MFREASISEQEIEHCNHSNSDRDSDRDRDREIISNDQNGEKMRNICDFSWAEEEEKSNDHTVSSEMSRGRLLALERKRAFSKDICEPLDFECFPSMSPSAPFCNGEDDDSDGNTVPNSGVALGLPRPSGRPKFRLQSHLQPNIHAYAQPHTPPIPTRFQPHTLSRHAQSTCPSEDQSARGSPSRLGKLMSSANMLSFISNHVLAVWLVSSCRFWVAI